MTTIAHKVIISGGMGDIGRAIVTRLATQGHHVAILYRSQSKEEVDTFVAELPGSGHYAIHCDITDVAAVQAAVTDAAAALGGLTVAVHASASPLVRSRASVIDPKAFRQQFEVTVFGGLTFFQAVLPHIRKEKSGHLIGITTAALDSTTPSGMAGYLCAKYALHGLLQDLGQELAPAIAVHEVKPGFVPTQMHADLPEAVRTFIVERTSTQTPDDVAAEVSSMLLP